jgi:hypothetical protein
VEHDVASLRYDFRRVAHDILAPVDTRIHCYLTDNGRTTDDTTLFSDTFHKE